MNPDVTRNESRGLCLTCTHAGSCMYLARAESPVWHCEEFDDSGPIGANAAAVDEPEPTTHVAEPPKADVTEGLRGLCINCDNLPTCCLPKAKSGVWHCEEYA